MLTSRDLDGLVAGLGDGEPAELDGPLVKAEPPAGWRETSEGRSLERIFTFTNLEELAGFVQASLAMAVFTAYPLDLHICGHRVVVHLDARDAAGLGGQDFEMAAVLNRCAEATSPTGVGRWLGKGDLDVEEGGAMESDELARRAQERLRTVLAALAEVDRELESIQQSLPEVPVEEAEAMERGDRPRSLLHFVRSMVEGMRGEELTALREAVETAVAKTTEELKAQWRTN